MAAEPSLEEIQRVARLEAKKALRRLPANVELDDLVSEATLAVWQAAKRYREGPGASFEAYARKRAAGAIKDCLRADDWLSRKSRGKLSLLNSAMERLRQSLKREPTLREVAEEADLSLEDTARLLALQSNKEAALEDSYCPFDDLHRSMDARKVIQAALPSLTPIERQTFEAVMSGSTLLRLAEDLMFSESRASQLVTQVAAKLEAARKKLGRSNLAAFPTGGLFSAPSVEQETYARLEAAIALRA